MNVYFTPKKMI